MRRPWSSNRKSRASIDSLRAPIALRVFACSSTTNFSCRSSRSAMRSRLARIPATPCHNGGSFSSSTARNSSEVTVTQHSTLGKGRALARTLGRAEHAQVSERENLRYDRKLAAQVASVFADEIDRSLKKRAKATLGLRSVAGRAHGLGSRRPEDGLGFATRHPLPCSGARRGLRLRQGQWSTRLPRSR